MDSAQVVRLYQIKCIRGSLPSLQSVLCFAELSCAYLIQASHSAERLFVPDLLDRHAWGGLVSPVLTAGQMI